MATFKCPHCGNLVTVAEKKTGMWWGIGCLIAGLSLPVILAVVGLLAAIAIPSFVRAREMSQQNACVNNMRIIEAAKDQVALELGYKDGQTLTDEQISKYIPGGFSHVTCPANGQYSVNVVGEEAECSVHGTMSNPKRLHGPPRRLPPPSGP